MKFQPNEFRYDEGTVNGLSYDTVERVVRCKDCKWYCPDTGFCNRNAGLWTDDDYCSYALWRQHERR